MDPARLVEQIRAGRCALVVGRAADLERLARLPIAAVWTTRTDDALEQGRRAATVLSDGELRGRHVLRLLDGIDDAAGVRRAWLRPSPARVRVGELYREGTLVFVGFAPDDPDLRLVLDRLLASFEPPHGRHVIVGDLPEEIRAEHNLDPVGPEFLDALADACAAAGAGARPDADDLDGWHARLAEDPADAEAHAALAAMEGRARDAGDTERQAEILFARVEVEPAAADRARLLREVARVLADEPKRALAALVAAAREHPADGEALREAEAVAAKASAWDELAAQLAEAVKDAGDAGLWAHLGRLYADTLRHDEYALASFREALKLDRSRVDALRGLAAIFRRQARWGELAEALAAQADIERDPALYLALGEIYDTALPQPAAATDAYERALALDPTSMPALRALPRLYERAGRGEDHLAALERLAELVPSLERPALLRRLAAELEDLRDGAARAASAYERLREIEPRASDAVRELERIYRAGGRWDALARLYDDVLQPDSPADAWYRAGETQRALGDQAGAEARFGRALARDPGHSPSLLALADIARGRGDPARAVTLLLDAERRAGTRREKAAILWDAAQLRRSLGQDATELAGRVLEVDPEHVEAGLWVVDAWVDAGRFADARPILEMLVRKAPADAARWHALLGRAAEALADSAAAAQHWAAAGDDPEAVLGLGRALLALGDVVGAEAKLRAAVPALPPERAAEVWRRIAACARARGDAAAAEEALLHAAEGEDRARIMEEIGDLRGERGDVAGALLAYEEALGFRPRGVLYHKVLEIHTAQKDWRRAVETLDKLCDKEEDRDVRAQYGYAAARIAEDELADPDAALPRYQRAADDGHARALAAAERLLAARGDWKGLARALRHDLKQHSRDALLWTRLGELLHDKLHERDAAISAYEAAAALEPSPARRDQLAHLYLEAGPAYADKAIAELQTLRRDSPERADVYRQLSALYADTGQRDKAYCLAEVLVLLGQAGEDEQRRAEALRPRAMRRPGRRLSEEDWVRLHHPREDRALGGALRALAGPLAATVTETRASLKLPREPAADPLGHALAQTLGIEPIPEVHVRPGLGAPQAAHVDERGRLVPVLLVPPPASEAEGAFTLAKLLAFFRPERLAIVSLGTVPRLEAALAAARAACGLEPTTPETAKLAGHLQRSVPSAVQEHAAILLRRAATDVLTWVSAADLTANRVGLLLCASLAAAARVVATEKTPLTSLPAKERLLDLVAFAASEEYFLVRKHIGLDLGATA